MHFICAIPAANYNHIICFPIDEKNEDNVIDNAGDVDLVSQSQVETQQEVVMEKG
jgi:hypothetical protein